MSAPLSPKSRAALLSGAGCASASLSGGCYQAYSSLIAFAYLLTLVETEAAGRAYATYGGIYIVASLAWLWVVESVRPDRWDIAGASICLIGAAVILWGPRG